MGLCGGGGGGGVVSGVFFCFFALCFSCYSEVMFLMCFLFQTSLSLGRRADESWKFKPFCCFVLPPW